MSSPAARTEVDRRHDTTRAAFYLGDDQRRQQMQHV